MILLYAPSHKQDSSNHGMCYTSRGSLAETRSLGKNQRTVTQLQLEMIKFEGIIASSLFKYQIIGPYMIGLFDKAF